LIQIYYTITGLQRFRQFFGDGQSTRAAMVILGKDQVQPAPVPHDEIATGNLRRA
jgi:hypothetical protein